MGEPHIGEKCPTSPRQVHSCHKKGTSNVQYQRSSSERPATRALEWLLPCPTIEVHEDASSFDVER